MYGESSPQHKEGFTPIGVYDVEGVGLCTGVSFAERQTASFTGKPPVFYEWAYICDTCTYEEDECKCGDDNSPLIRAKTNYSKAKYTTLEKQEATPLRVEASRTIHPTNREEQ